MIKWNEYPKITPPKDKNLLITLDISGKRVITISGFSFDPFEQKWKMDHEENSKGTVIAWAELPNPYTGKVSKTSMKLRDLIK